MIETKFYCDRCGTEIKVNSVDHCKKYSINLTDPSSWLAASLTKHGILCNDCYAEAIEGITALLEPTNE